MDRWIEVCNQDEGAWNNFQQGLADLLDAAIETSGATKGNLQVFNRSCGELQMVAQRGFDAAFIQQLDCLRPEGHTVCCRAFRIGRRVAVSDVITDPTFERYRDIFAAAGFRAVQSTPILLKDGSVGGVYSTHYPTAQSLPPETESALDDLSNQMAPLLAGLNGMISE